MWSDVIAYGVVAVVVVMLFELGLAAVRLYRNGGCEGCRTGHGPHEVKHE